MSETLQRIYRFPAYILLDEFGNIGSERHFLSAELRLIFNTEMLDDNFINIEFDETKDKKMKTHSVLKILLIRGIYNIKYNVC